MSWAWVHQARGSAGRAAGRGQMWRYLHIYKGTPKQQALVEVEASGECITLTWSQCWTIE